MAYIADPEAPARKPLWVLFRVPIVVLTLASPLVALPFVWGPLGLPDEGAIPVGMLGQVTILVSAIVLTAWWLLFSSFRWYIVFPSAFILVGLVASFCLLTIADFKLTLRNSQLLPRVRFIWEPTPEEYLARHLENQAAKNDDLPPIDATVGPEDFAEYRGRKRDGVVMFAKLQTDWAAHPPKELWKQPCPGGYGGVAVAGNIAVTLQQRDDQEVVVCYDRATGRERWTFDYKAKHKDIMGDGPRSTPTIHDGRIYTLGATGELVCVSAGGQKQWSINILDDSKAKNIKWGATASPLIVDHLVIALAGIDPENPTNASLVAYDQKTGTKRWAVGNRRAAYSSPMLVKLAGMEQILIYDAEGLVSYSKTGKELWSIAWPTKMDMNMIQPLLFGADQVFISAEASEGCAMYRIKAPTANTKEWAVEVVWKNKNLGARYANPVSDGKSIFALHSIGGELRCLDVATGAIKWRGERQGPGQMLLTDGALLVVNDKGVVTLHAVDAAEDVELARLAVFNDKMWNTPTLAGDQLILRNQENIACFKLTRP